MTKPRVSPRLMDTVHTTHVAPDDKSERSAHAAEPPAIRQAGTARQRLEELDRLAWACARAALTWHIYHDEDEHEGLSLQFMRAQARQRAQADGELHAAAQALSEFCTTAFEDGA